MHHASRNPINIWKETLAPDTSALHRTKDKSSHTLPTCISSSLHFTTFLIPSPPIHTTKMTGVLNGNGPSAELAPGQ